MRLIDADALDDVIQILNVKKWDITRNNYKLIDAVLSEFPTIEERKKGKWICTDDIYEDGVCSCCGLSEEVYEYVKNWNYCPNCGAEME